jgi:mannose-1-phosphate guanylyltransferase/mannose-6-phosphate isomerase
MIHPVILCGGSGTRLWPSSRKTYPKQFAKLVGDQSLYQMTLQRFTGPDFAAPLIMTGDDFRFMATDARVVIEPTARDTAPAILTAALLLQNEPDALMLVAPSDHVIGDIPAFLETVLIGKKAAEENGALITFGVTPDRPETGYGYLQLPHIPKDGAALTLESFREKPDLETANTMLKAGNYLWNGGIFLFQVTDILAAFETHAPDLMAPCKTAVTEGRDDLGFFRLGPAYDSARAISFDYAIMEKAETVMVVPLTCPWSDLGSWDALWQAEKPDEQGLATYGSVTALDCTNSYLRSEEDSIQLVGLGLNNVVAVAMRDAVLVADKSRTQDVKAVVGALRASQVAQADEYPRFHRPWGWYETLCLGSRFQVKRIMVKPEGVLSLQSHHHRSEHWIVVAGTAEVTIGEEVKLLSENQSVYIPLGAVHRMANPGKLPMYLIEVQTGSYLGEDDIQRYEDIYDRA